MSKFTFSKQTIDIIENYSRINPGMLFREGSELRTISKDKDFVGISTIPESIPQQFGIYDLSKFLSVLSTFKEATISLSEHFASITNADGKGKTYKYKLSSPTMILAPSTKKLTVQEPILDLELSGADLKDLTKTLSISKHPEVAFIGEDGKVMIRGVDKTNTNDDVYENVLGRTDKTFNLKFNIEKFVRLLPTGYKVTLDENMCLFANGNVNYFIAPEAE